MKLDPPQEKNTKRRKKAERERAFCREVVTRGEKEERFSSTRKEA